MGAITILLILLVPFWVLAILDVLKSKRNPNEKAVWLLITLLFAHVGALSYLLFGLNRKNSFFIKNIDQELNNIKKVFSRRKIIVKVFLLELSLFIVLGLIAFGASFLAYQSFQQVNQGTDFTTIQYLLGNADFNDPALEANLIESLHTMKLFFIQQGLILLAGLLLVTFVWTVGKAYVWHIILDQKVQHKNLPKFYVVNLYLAMVGLALILIQAVFVKENALPLVFLGFFVIAVHLLYVTHFAFTKKPHIKHAIKSKFTTGLGKVHFFIIPYTLAGIVYLPIELMMRGLSLAPPIAIGFNILILVLFFTILKMYIAETLKRVHPKE